MYLYSNIRGELQRPRCSPDTGAIFGGVVILAGSEGKGGPGTIVHRQNGDQIHAR